MKCNVILLSSRTSSRAVWQAKLTSSCPNCVMLLFVVSWMLSPSEGRRQEEHRGRRRGEENLYKITAFSPAGTSLASPHCGSVAAGAAELGIIRSASWFITLETYLNNCLAASATPAPLLHCTVGDEGVIARNTDFSYMSIFYRVFDLPAPVPLLSTHCTQCALQIWIFGRILPHFGCKNHF